jgi:hypothetical protein
MTGVLPIAPPPGADCTICTEKLDHDAVKLATCDHVFHCACLLEWVQGSGEGNRRCPNCRAELYANNGPSDSRNGMSGREVGELDAHRGHGDHHHRDSNVVRRTAGVVRAPPPPPPRGLVQITDRIVISGPGIYVASASNVVINIRM